MQYSIRNFLSSTLVPELCSYITAGSSCYIELTLVCITAFWAFPYKLTLILNYLDFAVKSAILTVI